MTIHLNGAGEAHAASLISQGKYNTNKKWSFTAADGNALLGSGENKDWTAYGNAHLATDDTAAAGTKAHYAYPVMHVDGVYREGLIAAKQRAVQNNAPIIAAAAARLLTALDNKEGKSENCLGIDETTTLLAAINVKTT